MLGSVSLAGSTIGDPFITNVFSRCGPSSDFLFSFGSEEVGARIVRGSWFILLSKKPPQELRLIPEEMFDLPSLRTYCKGPLIYGMGNGLKDGLGTAVGLVLDYLTLISETGVIMLENVSLLTFLARQTTFAKVPKER